MNSTRIEAFSDGVIAIIITIMVLELKVPHGDTWGALLPLIPVMLSYLLSFVYVGIYWNNHHHMLHTCEEVTGPILWANLHLLFWLSLFPITTAWVGENYEAKAPTALYGAVLYMAAMAYFILQKRHYSFAGQGFAAEKGSGRRLEGQSVRAPVFNGYRPVFLVALDGAVGVPGGGAALVHSR